MSIIKYANILHAHGVLSAEAKAYKKLYKDDLVFQKRAKVVDNLFLDRKRILKLLEKDRDDDHLGTDA